MPEWVVRARDGVAVATLGDAFVALYTAPLTEPRWQWCMSEVRRITGQAPDGMRVFNIILSTASPPNAALRGTMQGDLRGLGTRMRRLVFLPLGDSLWFSLVRAIVRGMLVLSGQSKLLMVVSTLNEGFDRLTEHGTAQTPTRTELERAVSALCTALDVEYPKAA